MGEARRALGQTESNWCLALKGGTGVTVSGYWFGRRLCRSTVQAAVNELVAAEPFMKSEIVSVQGKLFFQMSNAPVVVDVVDEAVVVDDEETAGTENWLKIIDQELNNPLGLDLPTRVLQVRLYASVPDADGSSLLIVRTHPGACDISSMAPLGKSLLQKLRKVLQEEESGLSIESILEKTERVAEMPAHNFRYLPAIENAVPKGAGSKPFWAHGVDILGYGLGSRRLKYLPFDNAAAPRKTKLIRSALSQEDTAKLTEALEKNSSSMYGALTAAGFKAAAGFKKVGSKGEHYGIAVLYNCRPVLDPVLSDSTLGFYHSALLKTSHVTEDEPFWKLAAHCSKDFSDAIKNRKHFTDIGDLNMLMVQAINHPNLTPSSSLRTALLSIYYEPIVETVGEVGKDLQLKDHVTGSSTSGVGPCLGLFPFMRNGELHINFLYCSPLFSRSTIQTLMNSILRFLTAN